MRKKNKYIHIQFARRSFPPRSNARRNSTMEKNPCYIGLDRKEGAMGKKIGPGIKGGLLPPYLTGVTSKMHLGKNQRTGQKKLCRWCQRGTLFPIEVTDARESRCKTGSLRLRDVRRFLVGHFEKHVYEEEKKERKKAAVNLVWKGNREVFPINEKKG